LSAGANTERAEVATSSAAGSAVSCVDALHEQLLDVMKQADELGYQGRYERLRGIVISAIDLPFMAEKTVGRHWKKLSDDEQQRWLSAFHDMTTATYADRFEGFSGQHFEVLGEEPARHDTVVVRAKLHDPHDDDVQLHYRLHQTPDGWRIIDVYLNGTVSELALRRSEYAAVLKREGFAKLIETIDGKTQKLADAALN
jgi:phospholipid transport system substrate-binding protein